jgi:hypothetical protein
MTLNFRWAATTVSTIAAIVLTNSSATAAMRWEAYRHADGRFEFVLGDTMDGDLQTLWLDTGAVHPEHAIHVAASGDVGSGTQYLGIVWIDGAGEPQSARLEQTGVVPIDWTPRKTSLHYHAIVAEALRGDDEQGFVARILIEPETPSSGRRELFSIQEEESEQNDRSEEYPGDTNGDSEVDTNDLLAVLTHYGIDCDGMVPCEGDGDANGFVDVNDILAVVQNFGHAADAPDELHNRLLYWQPVGGSYEGPGYPNHIHPQIYNDEDGWQADIDHRIGPVVDRLGSGAFDMWLHNIAGYWYDHDQTWPTPDTVQPMIFEQLEHARQQRPGLVNDLGTLVEYLDGQDIGCYAYVGLPRCWDVSGDGEFEYQEDHGNSDLLHRYYGELLEHGFKGIGHDSSVHNPEGSPWLTEMVPELERRGVDVFLESIPRRHMGHLLGHSVVAEHRIWQIFAEEHPEDFFTEQEINDAGGRTIHILTWPAGMSPTDSGWDPDFDYHTWRFETGKRLLGEGKTVALGLNGLLHRGYPIEELVAAAQ